MKARSLITFLTYGILAITCILAFYFYAHFPAQVAVHWNGSGQADGYGNRGFAAFFFPLVMVVLYVILTFLPRIDPHYKNYQQFERTYQIFKLVITTFFLLVYLIASFSGLGIQLPVGVLILMIVGVFIATIGYYLRHLKKNWFIGIRTPWTLSDDLVWTKTHQMGSTVFVVGGLLMVISAFLPGPLNIILFIIIIAIIAIVPIVYSYIIYRSLKRN